MDMHMLQGSAYIKSEACQTMGHLRKLTIKKGGNEIVTTVSHTHIKM